MTSFDEAAATWDDDPTKLQRARSVAENLRRRLPLHPEDRVLDVGGGTGQLSLQLADAVGTVTVSDASSGMVQAAARNIEAAGLGDRFQATRLDLTREAAPGAPYDGVWSMLALHHVPDVGLLLRGIRGAVRPGGWVALVDLDHDPGGAFHQHRHDGEDVHDGFPRDEVVDTLGRAGFVDVEVGDGGQLTKDVEGQDRVFTMFLALARAPGSG